MKISEQQFRELLNRYLEGSASPEERALLDSFFESYKSEEGSPASMNAPVHDELLHSIHTRIQRPTVRNGGRMIRLWASMAAVISLAIMVFFYSDDIGFRKAQVAVSTVIEESSRAGEKVATELPDGTKVRLNGDSKIRYPEDFGTAARTVELQGEAYFEVTKDNIPFVVHTGETRTEVLGTSFNVKSRTGRTVEVTLVEGEVNVIAPSGVASVLSPDHHATVDLKSGEIHTRRVDVLAYISWKDNVLYFDQTSLKDAVSILRDWYGVRIDLRNPALHHCLITAKYQDEPLGNVLSSLQFLLNLRITQLSDAHYSIDGKGCE